MIVSGQRRVVLATRNHHKVLELQRMLGDVGLELVSLDAIAPGAPELVEDGLTFEANALAKARQAAAITGLSALADDSGLEVDALGGAPGVYSARYGGGRGDAAANNARLLAELAEVPGPERTARFRCVIALVGRGGEGQVQELTFEGCCAGRITFAKRGTGGFGYDPLFLLPDRDLTVAELSDVEKDAISHRGKAVRELRRHLLGLADAARGLEG